MFEKRMSNFRQGKENTTFVSFCGAGYLYLNVGIRRLWNLKYPDIIACDVYVDSENQAMKIELNKTGEYNLCPNDEEGFSGYKVCLYNARDCGIKRGRRYPVKFCDNDRSIEFSFAEEV